MASLQIELIHKFEVRRLRPWDAHPRWEAGESSGWCASCHHSLRQAQAQCIAPGTVHPG